MREGSERRLCRRLESVKDGVGWQEAADQRHCVAGAEQAGSQGKVQGKVSHKVSNSSPLHVGARQVSALSSHLVTFAPSSHFFRVQGDFLHRISQVRNHLHKNMAVLNPPNP